MIWNSTFKNCCFKIPIKKRISKNMVNSSRYCSCDSNRLIFGWYHVISVNDNQKIMHFFFDSWSSRLRLKWPAICRCLFAFWTEERNLTRKVSNGLTSPLGGLCRTLTKVLRLLPNDNSMDRDSISTELMHSFDRTLKLNELCM